jgi:hypothetical protein
LALEALAYLALPVTTVDVLKLADAAAGVMAAIADQVRGRGMTCTAAYDALVNQK